MMNMSHSMKNVSRQELQSESEHQNSESHIISCCKHFDVGFHHTCSIPYLCSGELGN